MDRSSLGANLIKEVLEKYNKVTVVGISSKPTRQVMESQIPSQPRV